MRRLLVSLATALALVCTPGRLFEAVDRFDDGPAILGTPRQERDLPKPAKDVPERSNQPSRRPAQKPSGYG